MRNGASRWHAVAPPGVPVKALLAALHHGHEPPFGIEWDIVSPEHVRLQVEPPEQLTEQLEVQVTSHVESPLQLTLLLGPTVTEHIEPLLQSMLHESLQVPSHVFWLPQASEQLPEPPQLL